MRAFGVYLRVLGIGGDDSIGVERVANRENVFRWGIVVGQGWFRKAYHALLRVCFESTTHAC